MAIHLDGQARKRRLLILINGREAWVRPQPFEAALRMAIQLQQGLGWVTGPEISVDRYHQVFWRLKEDLKCTGIDVERLIENNAYKQYRFSVPRENITWDKEKIRLHAPELARLLGTEESAV